MGNFCQTDTTNKPEIYDLIEPVPYPQSFEKLKQLVINNKNELEKFFELSTQPEIREVAESTESFDNNNNVNIENNTNNIGNHGLVSYQKIIIDLDHKFISQQLMNKITKFLLNNKDLVHLELNFSIYFENIMIDQKIFEDLCYLPQLHYLNFNILLNESEYCPQNYFTNLQKILLNQKELRVLILNLKESQLSLQYVENIFEALKKLEYLRNLHLIFDKNNIKPLLKSNKFISSKPFRQLNYLKLSFQQLKEQLSQEDMQILTQKLQSLKNIKHVEIDLSKNDLRSKKLITFLQNLKTLQKIDNLSLNLSQNNLNKDIIPELKQELKQLKSLQVLQLDVSLNPQLDLETSNQLLEEDMIDRFQSIQVIADQNDDDNNNKYNKNYHY
ncbi:hypothetical protein PPERSA_10456 [Pseudocohnilembus persalinus]|uniref:Uncharacterized protein n=1 Tax=Pseudocohnilembus persalinus TaxID=266149 RepID=A0A0V0R0P4_PSEPJ|nr:hypothetical protein PPERSA_10456 [Pseudocohnilembus persalinus]|eukprot:KRX08094.1 hypothetical protein PPERSA_10456 [Pseudocohnilembus persalinus]